MDQVVRTLTALIVLLTCAGVVPGAAESAAAQPLEYHVKAAFLLNFAKFVEWPAAESAHSDSPFGICIWGDDPFGPILDRTLEGEVLNGQRLVVERVHGTVPKDCRVLFVSKSAKDATHAIASVDKGVLTVGDTADFLKEGGMIAFVIENRRVRFDIHAGAAAKAGIKLSSKLLTVARNVEN